jgi:excisionase family DNA binding protein
MQWLKVRGVAARADVDPKVVYRAIHDGKLKAATVGAGRNFRVADLWVDEWLELEREALRVKEEARRREALRTTTRGLVAVPSRRLG